ncbi:hypothetical protein [Bdellovibrio reynosensis]|uniref:YkuD domain-containing protein n=1 Tax=Bdellovibrio reynosensis TaxID=2835041 RepID=A0ABY4C8N7_9BACT|nr:hypothetical protein [Bdellovibrio reynosensis]UOF01144.1 hypothetical protein MNR06_15705 [Bdellovibrio reynosensis]
MKKIILLSLLIGFEAFAFSKSSATKLLTLNGRIGGGGGGGNSQYNDLPSGSCGNVPAHIKKAFNESIAFTKSCSAARIASNKMVAINDFSGVNKPMIYIFDLQGNCKRATGISWGRGIPRRDSINMCSKYGSLKTPPGFHITTPYSGVKYDNSNSLGLGGLSGQDSLGRGILLHGKWYTDGANTYGCIGVPDAELQDIKSLLGHGSLVYNYSGDRQQSDCSNPAGVKHTCDPEQRASEALRNSGGGKEVPRSKEFVLSSPPAEKKVTPAPEKTEKVVVEEERTERRAPVEATEDDDVGIDGGGI